MSRAQIILRSRAERERAIKWIGQAPTGTRIEFKAAKRTLDQNAKLWACLTEISRELVWYGRRLSPTQWKCLFMDALNREADLVPSIDGNGLVNLGRASSDLSKNEFGDLLECITAFATEQGIVLRDPTMESIDAA